MPLLPTINASLNAAALVLLLGGRWAISGRRVGWHRNFMVSALVASTSFLACYLFYHLTVAGVTHYRGVGMMRTVYFAILMTHTPLAGLMTPFIVGAVWFAAKGRFDVHTRITRWLWPVWVYVSITGVLIYLMLYVLPQPA